MARKRKKIEVPEGQMSLFDWAAQRDLNAKEVRETLHGDAAPAEKINQRKEKKEENKEKEEKKTPNRRGRGRTKTESKNDYSEYIQIKRQVVELEKRNKQYLVLFPASDIKTNKKHSFYNMGGTSAILYCHEIGPRIKRKPTLRRDMDNCNDGEKFHSGICSIANLEKLTELLNNVGIKRENVKDSPLVFFKLNREYTKTEVKEMLKQEQKRLDALNKLLYSKVLHPDIHRQILELKKIIPVKVKNMDKVYREVVGREMLQSLMLLVRTYSQMAHGSKEELAAAKILMEELDALLGYVSLMNEIRVWDVSSCSRVGDVVVGAKKLIKGKIINKYETTG